MSRRQMLSRRRLLQSASAITAARNRVAADTGRTREDPLAADDANAKARDLMAPVPDLDKAETLVERIDDLKSSRIFISSDG
jgi:hypothetical protein